MFDLLSEGLLMVISSDSIPKTTNSTHAKLPTRLKTIWFALPTVFMGKNEKRKSFSRCNCLGATVKLAARRETESKTTTILKMFFLRICYIDRLKASRWRRDAVIADNSANSCCHQWRCMEQKFVNYVITSPAAYPRVTRRVQLSLPFLALARLTSNKSDELENIFRLQ